VGDKEVFGDFPFEKSTMDYVLDGTSHDGKFPATDPSRTEKLPPNTGGATELLLLLPVDGLMPLNDGIA
jgi:hypothetical protein